MTSRIELKKAVEKGIFPLSYEAGVSWFKNKVLPGVITAQHLEEGPVYYFHPEVLYAYEVPSDE